MAYPRDGRSHAQKKVGFPAFPRATASSTEAPNALHSPAAKAVISGIECDLRCADPPVRNCDKQKAKPWRQSVVLKYCTSTQLGPSMSCPVQIAEDADGSHFIERSLRCLRASQAPHTYRNGSVSTDSNLTKVQQSVSKVLMRFSIVWRLERFRMIVVAGATSGRTH